MTTERSLDTRKFSGTVTAQVGDRLQRLWDYVNTGEPPANEAQARFIDQYNADLHAINDLVGEMAKVALKLMSDGLSAQRELDAARAELATALDQLSITQTRLSLSNELAAERERQVIESCIMAEWDDEFQDDDEVETLIEVLTGMGLVETPDWHKREIMRALREAVDYHMEEYGIKEIDDD